MANPAFQRSGVGNGEPKDERQQDDTPTPGAFAAYTTADLIALRDELLEQCLDLESRMAGGANEESADPVTVRTQIDEIHQELAFRDLAERTAAQRRRQSAEETAADTSRTRAAGLSAQIIRRSARLLKAIEMRSRFMDELAQAARAEGRLDQAATFTLNAQKLDLERVEVLRQLSALSVSPTDKDE